jgi:hypothetical protein
MSGGIVQYNPQTKHYMPRNADGTFAKPLSTPGMVKPAPSERPAGPTVISQNAVTSPNGFNTIK